MLSNIFNQPKQTPVYPAIFVWFKQFNTISDAEKPNKKTTMKTLHTTIQNSARCRNMQDRSNAGIYLNSDAANSWKTNLKTFFNFPKTALCNFSQNQHPTILGIAPHYTAVVVLHPFSFINCTSIYEENSKLIVAEELQWKGRTSHVFLSFSKLHTPFSVS